MVIRRQAKNDDDEYLHFTKTSKNSKNLNFIAIESPLSFADGSTEDKMVTTYESTRGTVGLH